MKQALFLPVSAPVDRMRCRRRQALELGTSGGGRCLGRPDLGLLEVGAPADIAVWPADDIEDIADPIAGLVLGPSRTVRHLLVGGDVVVENGGCKRVDLRAAHAELTRHARGSGADGAGRVPGAVRRRSLPCS